MRDDDKQPDADQEAELVSQGCLLAKWPKDYALEHALFMGLDSETGVELVKRAVARYGQKTIDAQVTQKLPKDSSFDFEVCETKEVLTEQERWACAEAAKSKQRSWFKDRGVGVMEEIARDVVGPALENSADWFKAEIDRIFRWAADGGG